MTIVAGVLDYLLWHYAEGFRSLFVIWTNIFTATVRLFSVFLLLRTLFSPWKRMEEHGREGDVEDFFASLAVNIISSIVGAMIRLCLIAAGLISMAVMLIVLAALIAAWIAAPIMALVAIAYGMTLLAS